MSVTVTAPPATTRRDVGTVPLGRLVAVELRKMFDTRAGVGLLSSIGVTAVLASAAVIAWAPDEAIAFGTFGSAVGIPMTVVLPIIAVLSVTSEWSQRSGHTTFTLAPRRGRVLLAKAVGVLAVGLLAAALALGVGALGNLVGGALTGVEPVWDLSFASALRITLALCLSMAVGFMLGLVVRSSAAAIVGYFVYAFVLPGLLATLAAFQGWFRDLQPWVDFNLATTRLYESAPSGEQWAQLGVTGLIWLALPLAVGVVLTLRAEVK